MKKKDQDSTSGLVLAGRVIAAVAIGLICVATLKPDSPVSPNDSVACKGWCDDSHVADFIRNIVLFMPMGFGLRLGGTRRRYVILAGTCLSAVIELLQIRVIVGRDASVLDWIANSIGTVSGVMLADYSRTLLRAPPRIAVQLAVTWMIVWLAIVVLGAWGIQPAPSAEPYWGQRAPRLRRFAPFMGQLLSVQVNGVELPGGRMTQDEAIRAPLRSGRLQVAAMIRDVATPYSKDIAPIARVADRGRREIMMIGRSEKDLVFRLRLRATALRLETPAFSLRDAFAQLQLFGEDDLAAPETLSVVLDKGRLRMEAKNGQWVRGRGFELTPAVAWTFFLPWDYWFGPNTALISWLLLGALLTPHGYWAGVAMQRDGARWLIVVTLSGIATGMWFVPWIFTLPTATGWQLLAVVVGASTGAMLSPMAWHGHANVESPNE